MSSPKKRWVWPNMLPRPWSTDRRHPACVISGKVMNDDLRGGTACSVVCKVQGNAMNTYQPTMQFLAEVPEVVRAAIALLESTEYLVGNQITMKSLDDVVDKTDALRAAEVWIYRGTNQ